MKNGWYSGLPVVALLAGLAAMPGHSRDKQSATGEIPQARASCPFAHEEIEAMMQELARLQQEVELAKGELAGEATRAMRELQAQLGGLQTELEAHKAELETRARDVAARARAIAGQELAPPDFAGSNGWLGVEIAEVTPEKAKEVKLPAEGGVLVLDVEKDSPAAKAGLKSGDVITEYNRERVEGTIQFRRLIRETPPGRTTELKVWRDGRSEKLSAVLASRPAPEGRIRVFGPHDFDFHFGFPGMHHWAGPVLGVRTEDISGQLGAYFGVPGGEGILVEEVLPGSAAEKAGLKAGDVIIKVDGEPVKTTMELRERLRGKREAKSVTLEVTRKGAEVSLPVEIESPNPVEPSALAPRTRL